MTTREAWDWIHRHGLLVVSGGLGVAALAVWLIGWGIRPGMPSAMPRDRHGLQVVGFYEDSSPGNGIPASGQSFRAHWNHLTQVSPLWYSVEPDGTVVNTGYDARVVNLAQSHHIAVVPLFINAGGSTAVLYSASTRSRAAHNIAATVSADHLNGASIDFELLQANSRLDLSAFVADVRHALPSGRAILAVNVFPRVDVPDSVNGAYDDRSLARVADYLVLMAYDHHYSGGPPGPVAPYSWVKDSVKAALDQVPARKLVLSIGMYGYDWVNNGQPGNAPTIADVQAGPMARSYGVPIQYRVSESQNTFSYTASGVPHIVWFMGDRSAAVRRDLAQHDHLLGISLWCLGMEDAHFWTEVP